MPFFLLPDHWNTKTCICSNHGIRMYFIWLQEGLVSLEQCLRYLNTQYIYIYTNTKGIFILSTHLFISGLCLNFSSALVMTLILRHTITKCRNIGLGTYLPLDHNIYLHKLTGYIIFGLAWLHAIMHICNFGMCLEF